MKLRFWILCGLLALTAGASGGFPLWLPNPSRNNPRDPLSPLYHPQAEPTLVAAPDPDFSATPTQAATATPAVTPTLTATPQQGSPTDSPTSGPTVTVMPGSTSVPSLTASPTANHSTPTSTFTATPSPTQTLAAGNGAWPVLTNFNADIMNDNAGANSLNPIAAADDAQDGCGVSSPPGSTASISSQTTGSDDGTPYLSLAYTVVTNTSCNYQYASVGFPFVSQTLTGMTGITFNIQSSTTVQVEFVTASSDSCLGSNNKMWYNLPSTGGAWSSVTLYFSQFTLVNSGCPYPLGNVKSLSFSVLSAGSGTVNLDNIALINTAAPTPTSTPTPSQSDGTWPVLTSFNLDITNNNAGADSGNPNAVFYDTQDGCGVSTPPGSTASMSAQTTGSDDSTTYLQVTYSVVANTACGYQDAGVAFPFVTEELSSYSEVKFDLLSSAAVVLEFKTATQDSCLGANNSMTYTVASTGGTWQSFAVPFASFTTHNSSCPFVPTDLSNIGDLSFAVLSPGSGTFDLDNISFQ